MTTTTVPTTHCDKTDVRDILFHQQTVIEFLVKNNSATDICGQLCNVYRNACMGTISVRRWVKHFEDRNIDITYQSH